MSLFFNIALKISRLFDLPICKGKSFHKRGEHILKALHPYLLLVKLVSFLCNKSQPGLGDQRPNQLKGSSTLGLGYIKSYTQTLIFQKQSFLRWQPVKIMQYQGYFITFLLSFNLTRC